MKKINLFLLILVPVFTLLGASVWEGSASVEDELYTAGLYAATNSFPVKTVVYVTNLENGKTIRLMVSSGLDSSGLLAVLSRDAAESIGLSDGSIGRIRMSESSDLLALSAFNEGRGLQAENETYASLDSYSIDGLDYGERIEGGEIIVNLPDAQGIQAVPEYSMPTYGLTLVPAETRPPTDESKIEQSNIISRIPEPVITDNSFIDPTFIDPTFIIEPVTEPARETVKTPGAYVFSAPMISCFEIGKYYVQIAAYSNVESVEYEIARIENTLPKSIMKIGSEEKPVYRVLIGPLNLGESGAILQRYKASYKDAFVWQGR